MISPASPRASYAAYSCVVRNSFALMVCLNAPVLYTVRFSTFLGSNIHCGYDISSYAYIHIMLNHCTIPPYSMLRISFSSSSLFCVYIFYIIRVYALNIVLTAYRIWDEIIQYIYAYTYICFCAFWLLGAVFIFIYTLGLIKYNTFIWHTNCAHTNIFRRIIE